jgi:hypothetical protein
LKLPLPYPARSAENVNTFQSLVNFGANMAECITALEYEGGITAIDSGMVRPQMAACYLLETESTLAVVEAGNNDSADRILQVIASRGRSPQEVSHVIVTHVHLDHAGGAGKLMQLMPNATLVAHPRGARHLIDPSRLEASARAVYGDVEFDRMYGTLIPVACRTATVSRWASGDWSSLIRQVMPDIIFASGMNRAGVGSQEIPSGFHIVNWTLKMALSFFLRQPLSSLTRQP